MDDKVLSFVYSNAQDEVSTRTLLRWEEAGHYIKGYSVNDGRVLTFRKDRVKTYLDGTESMLREPYAPAPPKPQREAPRDARPQILFTGFAKVQRHVLETKADADGLQVMKTVTQNLVFLCCGPTAGPAKVEKSREQGVYIVDEAQFHQLLDTGELPDSVVDELL